MFFQANQALVAPYNVLVVSATQRLTPCWEGGLVIPNTLILMLEQDTNFLSHTVRAKLPLLETMMDCLYASCTPIITDCVMAELEKLGPKYRIALQIARDERWTREPCSHKGTYADDCGLFRSSFA